MEVDNISLENHFRELAQRSTANSEIYSCWQMAKIEYAKILENVKLSFPFYSRHDVSHSQSIIHNIERLLGSDGISKLGITDTWLLLECAHIHDLGMVLSAKEVKEEWNSPRFRSYRKDLLTRRRGNLTEAALTIDKIEKRYGERTESWPIEVSGAVRLLVSDFFRRDHSIRSEVDYIEKWIPKPQVSIVKKRIIDLAAKIAMLHTAGHSSIFQLQKCTNGQTNDYMHPRFIATLLRLGDVLDLDNSRFDEHIRALFSNEIPSDSITHYDKHQSVNHFLITPQLIEVFADCKNENVYFEMNSWIGILLDEINNATLNWIEIAPDSYPVPPKAISKICINGMNIINGFEDIKYDISQQKMFEIIRGGDVYDNEFVFMRELIQNALDASKIKYWSDVNNGNEVKILSLGDLKPWDCTEDSFKNYEIVLNINATSLDENRTKINFTITDNGIGFSTSDVKRIARVGNSWNKDEKKKIFIEEMPAWLRPTGSFGIGLQAAFLISEEIDIHTINEKNSGMIIKLRSSIEGKEQILVMEGDVPNGYRTKVSVDFIVNNIEVANNRLTFLEPAFSKVNVFNQDIIIELWKLRILSEIKSYISYSMFPIRFNGLTLVEEAYFNDHHNPYFEKTLPIPKGLDSSSSEEAVLYKELSYKVYEDLKGAIVWDEEHNAFLRYKFYITRHSDVNIGGIDMFYHKEILVSPCWRIYDGIGRQENPIMYNGHVFSVSLSTWGWDTKECLMLSRSAYKPKYKQLINNIIDKHTRELMKYIACHLVKSGIDDYDSFSFYYMFLRYAEVNDIGRVLQILSSNTERMIKVLEKGDNQEYKVSNKSAKEIIESYPQLYFSNYYFDARSSDGRKDLPKELNECSASWIIFDQPYIYWLETLPKREIFHFGNELRIYEYDRNAQKSANYVNVVRWKYPAVQAEKYPELAISRLPYAYSIKHGKTNETSPLMLQPYPEGEIDGYRFSARKNDFEDLVYKDPMFEELLDYVYNNQIEKGKYSIDNIKSSYSRYIDNHWNLKANG